jgi:hypothetical protein
MIVAMRALVIVCALLAACDNGVVIEVTPAPGVATARVKLFIGLARCDDCPGIQPPRVLPGISGEVLPGAVYYREDSFRTTIERVAAVEDGVARFRIEASDIGDRFELAVAIDEGEQSAVLIPSLSLDEAGVYKVQLVATGQNSVLGPKPATTSGTFVEIWKQATGTIPCIGFERWDAGMLVGDRVFIVPASDLDCDEVAETAECNPYAYKAEGIPTFEEVRCTTAVLEDNAGLCKLGGPSCSEVDGTEHDCMPSEYCLPGAYCETVTNTKCSSFATTADLQRCLFETFPSAGLRCQVPFKRGDSGQAIPCGSVPFQLPTEGASGTICVGPKEEMMLDEPPDGSPLAFEYAISYATVDEESGVASTLSVKGRYEGFECRYKLEIGGELAADELGSAFLPEVAFAQFWVQRPGGPIRKLLVPIGIQPIADETCSQEPTCMLQFEIGDPLAKCLLR